MNFFRDKKKTKKSIEDYVLNLREEWGEDKRFLENLCRYQGIEFLKGRRIYGSIAFKFEGEKRGVLFHEDSTPFLKAKKIGHHFLGHFERNIPIYLTEAESNFFASAVMKMQGFSPADLLFGGMEFFVPASAIFARDGAIKRFLREAYRTEESVYLL